MRFNRLAVALSITFFANCYAATITNNIQGVGPQSGLVNPYICIQNQSTGAVTSVAPGQSVDGNAASGNPYYVGASLRFNGCDNSDSYLGFAGYSVSSQGYSFGSYTAPQGIHIGYTNPSIDSNGNITGQIQYTAIDSNLSLLPAPPSTNTTWPFVGINLSGLEFSKMIDPFVIPNLSQADASSSTSDLADTQAFVAAGMNTVRVPVRWAYLQMTAPLQGYIDSGYYSAYVKPMLESLTSAGIYAIVDLHSYMHYSMFGKQFAGCGDSGACPDGTENDDPNAYVDVWKNLYTLMSQDPNIHLDHILLDLINEPVASSDQTVFDVQVAVIKNLRQQGFNGYILVEGNNWSGLHSWTTGNNATIFTAANFANAGITDLSKIIINVHQYLDSNYSGTQSSCQTDLSTKGPNGFNLQAFADYLKQNHLKAIVTEFGAGTDSSTCTSALTQFLDYLQANAAGNKDYGFIGWTIWSAGHGWGSYNLRVTPGSYQMSVLKKYLQQQKT